MEEHIILGIHVTDRLTHAQDVQQLFTQYGANIKTRLGLHEVERKPAPNGLVLLEMYGGEAVSRELAAKLSAIEGIEVQTMIFRH